MSRRLSLVHLVLSLPRSSTSISLFSAGVWPAQTCSVQKSCTRETVIPLYRAIWDPLCDGKKGDRRHDKLINITRVLQTLLHAAPYGESLEHSSEADSDRPC